MFYQHTINENTKLAIWKIEEPEAFFLKSVPLQRTITHPQKRLQHLAGRYLLQYLFADFPFNEIIIADTRKPYLPDEQYHFSISHCSSYAAAIVSKKERVGVDIEVVSEKVLSISHKFLNCFEKDFISTFPHIPISTTIAWSAKEAIYKWWSYGGVDFMRHIRLQPFLFQQKGNIDATFMKNNKHISLQLCYELFEGLCLVWIVSAK